MPPRKGSPAELLLKKVNEKYLSLETYQDEGTVLSVSKYPDPEDDYGTNVKFRTMFKRPYFFMFEWTQDTGGEFGPKDCVWYDGESSYFLTDIDGPVLVKFPSLRYAFFPGWTRFAAEFIQWMVWEGYREYRLHDCFSNPIKTKRENLENIPCRVIIGTFWRDTDARIHIGEEDLMIRRFERRRQETQKDHEAFVKSISRDRTEENEKLLKSPQKYGITKKDLELFEKKMEPLKEPKTVHPEDIDIETRSQIRINEKLSDAAFKYELPAGTQEVPLEEMQAYILSKTRHKFYNEFEETR